MSDCDLTADRLRELLHYDPETGVFTCRVRITQRFVPGRVMGYTTQLGYRVIELGGKAFKVHRLAWLYMTGAWPRHVVDHIDGNRLNNRFSNLRDIPRDQNAQNRSQPNAGNPTGYLGVNIDNGRFRARIRVGYKLISLGYFGSPEAAHAAYVDAKRRLHPGSTL